MKKMYLTLLTSIFCCIYVNAQNPFPAAFPVPDPPIERKEFTIYGIAVEANAPVINGKIDAIWEEVTAHPLEEVVIDDDDEMTATVKWMYDDTYLYLLVEVMNDDVMVTAEQGDHFELMYQKDFGGLDTGTVAGHDDDADWRHWYWLRDGDRYTTFPTVKEIYEYHSSGVNADFECYNWETPGVEIYTMQDEILFNESMKINVDIDTNTDGTFNYTYEVALKWDSKWLNWDTPPTTDDTLGIDISVRDADEDGGDKVGHINLNDYGNNAWCASTAVAMVHIGEKNIHIAGEINVTSPISSSNWDTESNYGIQWTDNISSNVKIELYNNFSFASTISSSTSSDGYYSWTIPSSINSGSNYRIKITSTTNASVYDYSDYFSITNNSTSDDTLEPNDTYDQAYSIGSILNYSNNNLTLTEEDEDWFSFNCDGATYYFKVEGYSFSTEGNYGLSFEKTGTQIIIETVDAPGDSPDTYMVLYDTDHSSILESDDDGGSGLFSKITYDMTCNTTTYNVNFTVRNNNTSDPVNNAEVTLGAYGSQYTNTSGGATFTDVAPENNLSYTVSATNYEQASSTISVINQNVTENVSLIPLNLKHDITFTVLDETLAPLPDAIVSLDGYGTLTTDHVGEVVFTNISPEDNISYTVTALDYQKSSSTVSVVDQDVNKQVNMAATPAGTYNVVFYITDKQSSPLSNAAINLSGYGNNKTSPDGKAIFSGVSPGSDIACYIENPGFIEVYDSVNVVDQDISKPIQLERGSYSITFIVTDQNDIAIEGAAVNLLGEGTQTTNASGQTVFSNVLSGNNLAYIVTSPEHATITDTIASFTDDMIETVKINKVDIAETAQDDIVLYPNPVKNTLFIKNMQSIERISIKSITGQTIKSIEVDNKKEIQLSTKDLKPGYYIIYFMNKNRLITGKKIIKY